MRCRAASSPRRLRPPRASPCLPPPLHHFAPIAAGAPPAGARSRPTAAGRIAGAGDRPLRTIATESGHVHPHWVIGVLRMAGKRSGADDLGTSLRRAPPAARLEPSESQCGSPARAARRWRSHRQAAPRAAPGRARQPASQQADADAAEPGVGASRRSGVAKLLAELHPQPTEDVAALVAVGDGSGAPPRIARGDLDDGPVAGRGQHRVDLGRVRFAPPRRVGPTTRFRGAGTTPGRGSDGASRTARCTQSGETAP